LHKIRVLNQLSVNLAYFSKMWLPQQFIVIQIAYLNFTPPKTLRCGHLSRYVTSHPGQLSLAIPSWVGTMSTNQKVTPCGCG